MARISSSVLASFVAVTLLGSVSVFGREKCADLLHYHFKESLLVKEGEQPLYGGVGVEMEMGISPEVTRMLIPESGEITPVGRQWANLSYDEQIKALNSHTAGQVFGESRTIPGIKTVGRLPLEGLTPATVLGEAIRPGQKIPLEAVMEDYVELMNHKSAGKIDGVELHLTNKDARLKPGSLAKGAWEIQDAAGVPRTHLHVHLIAKMPDPSQIRNPEQAATYLADLYRRSERLLQSYSIVHYKSFIQKTEFDDYTYWSPLEAGGIKTAWEYFRNYFSGLAPNKPPREISYSSMRGAGTYRKCKECWGLELRSINPTDQAEWVEGVLNQVHLRMNQWDESMLSRAERWNEAMAKRSGSKGLSQVLDEANYNQSQTFTWYIQQYDGEMKLLLEDQLVRDKMVAAYHEKSLAVDMVLQNYETDPLFFDQPALLDRIRKAQIRALKRIRAEPFHTSILSDFLLESGIFEADLKSFGIKMTPHEIEAP